MSSIPKDSGAVLALAHPTHHTALATPAGHDEKEHNAMVTTTSRNEDRETRPGYVGNGFPSDRPVMSAPAEQPIEANPDPARMAEKYMSGSPLRPLAAGEVDPEQAASKFMTNDREGHSRTPTINDPNGGAQVFHGDSRWRDTVELLSTRPSWQTIAAPRAVQGAWAALTLALEAAQVSRAAVHQVAVDARTAAADELTAVQQAAARGEGSPEVTVRPDYDRDRDRHGAAARGHMDRAKAARAAYDATVRDELPEWRGLVAKALQPAHEAAQQKLVDALQAYEDLQDVIAATSAMGSADGQELRPLPQLKQGKEGIEKVVKLLDGFDSSKPIEHARLHPSRGERFTWATCGDARLARQLQVIEQGEGYEYTSFTRGRVIEVPPSPYRYA